MEPQPDPMLCRLRWLSSSLVLCAVALASATPLGRSQSGLSSRENHAWKIAARASEFSDIPHVSERTRCEEIHSPQALLTPNPVPLASNPAGNVKVSFIVGTDGRVHSPLILQSGGVAGDRNVLWTVKTWRYRPATCNGVPTEAEGKIEFSIP